MLKRLLAKRDELLRKLDDLFAKDSQGCADYDATEWTDAKQATYDGTMTNLRKVEAGLETIDGHEAAHERAEARSAMHALRNPATRSIVDLREDAPSGLNGNIAALTAQVLPVAQAIQSIARGDMMNVQTTADAKGGFTIPVTVSPDWESKLATESPMLALATYRELDTGRTHRVPVVDASGTQAQEIPENTSLSAAVDLAFSSVDLDFGRWGSHIFTITNELIQDSSADVLAEFVVVLLNHWFRSLSDAMTVGTGGTVIDGFTESAKVTTALTTAAATAVTWQELVQLFGAVPAGQQRNAVFQFNQSVETYLMHQRVDSREPVIIKDVENGGVTGTGGGVVVANGLRVPYAVNPALPDIAAASKSIYCGNYAKYRAYGAPNNNAMAAPEILIFNDSTYASKNTIGIAAHARRAGKLVDADNSIRFITQKA